MALIDVLKWDNPGNFVAFKVGKEHATALRTMTQLIVNESQYALFLLDGRICDVFTAGRYTLTTNNFPILSRLINMPFGGDSPFAAEVWFVNRTVSLNLKFGTAQPITVEDPTYQIVVPLTAHGQFGLEIVDPGIFVQKIVGVAPAFDLPTTVDYFKAILISRLKSRISHVIVREKVGVLEIESEMDNISRSLEQEFAPDYAEYGLALRAFRLMSLSVRADDPSVAVLKAAKANAARRRIEGFSFSQERMFEILQTGAANEGPTSPLL
jgi:membrane protease subunit (stomatin/prohibitin family)